MVNRNKLYLIVIKVKNMQSWKKFEYRIRDFFINLGFKAHRVPVSGASNAIKGDIIAKEDNLKLRIDAKYTISKERIKIRRESLEKIEYEAEDEEIPLVVFSFYRHRKLYCIVSSEFLSNEVEKKKNTWARDTVLLKKNELDILPMELEFKDDMKSYLILELGNFMDIVRN